MGRQSVSGKRFAGGSSRSLSLATPPTRADAPSVTSPGSIAWQAAVLPVSGHAGPGGPEPFSHRRPWPVLSAVSAARSHLPPSLAGVGRCPLARCHGLSVGLLVCVQECRPVSPLSVESCSGAGSVWRVGEWIASSTVDVVSAPAGRTLSLALSAGPECCVHRIASSARPRRSGVHLAGRGWQAISPRTRVKDPRLTPA